VALILVLHTNPEARGRIRLAVERDAAARASHRLQWLERWSEVRDRAAGAGVVAVVDAYPGGALAAGPVAELLRALPGLPLVVYGDFSRRPASDCLALFEAGVRLTLTLGVDDGPEQIRALIARAEGRRVLAPAAALLHAAHLPRRAVRVMEFLFRESHRHLRAADLAAHCGCSVRTLERYLGEAGLPAPGSLIGWSRLLHAASLLDDRSRTLENVAAALGYSSGAALRKSLRRHAGLTPGELSRRGGAAWLAERFLARVHEAALTAGAAAPAACLAAPPAPHTPGVFGLAGVAAGPAPAAGETGMLGYRAAHQGARGGRAPLASAAGGAPARKRPADRGAPSSFQREGTMRLTVTSMAEHRSALRHDLAPGVAGGALGLVAPGASTTCAASSCCSCCTAAIASLTHN
jgi:AraC-like DNA-binding protein